MGMLEVIEQVLKKEKKPLTPKEIFDVADKAGLVRTTGKTPWATIGARIYTDIKRRGQNSIFKKAGRGKFILNSEPADLKSGSFKKIAYLALKESGRLLSTQEIISYAKKKGLLKSGRKTPEATMRALIYVDLKRKDSVFVKLGKNRFGLREWDSSVIEKEIKSEEERKAHQEMRSAKTRSIVGDPINVEGLRYGPLNENGVIFLFAKLQNKFGIVVENIQAAFPDARARRKTERGWEEVWMEFEYRSSHFKQHGHDSKECDIIVCWEHDWPDCPLEVIELKRHV